MEKKDRYKAAREHGKLTQRELAEKVPMSQQMVSKLENGGSADSSFDVRIAVVCGVRPEWLDAEDGEMVPGKGAAPEPMTADRRVKGDILANRNALAALSVAMARTSPRLGAAFLEELKRMPEHYRSRGLFAVLIGILERDLASQAADHSTRPAPKVRKSVARKQA